MIRFAIFADSDLKGPLGYFAFPVMDRAVELAADEYLIIGDHDHRNAHTANGMHALHDDRDAVALAHGLPPGHVWEVYDDHDAWGNNCSHAAPGRELLIDIWSQRRPMLPDNLLPTCIAQCGDFGLAFDGRPLVRLILLDLRMERYTAWTNRTILGPVQKPWLADRIATSPAHWLLIASSVTWNPTLYSDADSWSGYQVDQAWLWPQLQGRNAIIVSGDIHSGGKVDDGTHTLGIPELSVPRMNEECFVAASAGLGQWTMAAPSPYQPGFGWVEFSEDEALVQVRDPDGAVRLELMVPASALVTP